MVWEQALAVCIAPRFVVSIVVLFGRMQSKIKKSTRKKPLHSWLSRPSSDIGKLFSLGYAQSVPSDGLVLFAATTAEKPVATCTGTGR